MITTNLMKVMIYAFRKLNKIEALNILYIFYKFTIYVTYAIYDICIHNFRKLYKEIHSTPLWIKKYNVIHTEKHYSQISKS